MSLSEPVDTRIFREESAGQGFDEYLSGEGVQRFVIVLQ